MTRPVLGGSILLILAAAGAASAGTPPPSAPPPPPAAAQATAFRASGALFTDDDLLLVEVHAGRDQLADSMTAYASRAGVFLPVGEFARVLDLAITVYPPEQKAAGWVLRETRTVSVDLRSHTLRVGDQTISIPADQAVFHADDVFLRIDLMAKLLPADLKFDARGLILMVRPREALPFQLRLERERRRQEIGGFTDKVSVLKVETPYLAFSPPSIDVTLNGAAGTAPAHGTGQYDVRAAGDLGYAAMQLFATSDSKGDLNAVRFTLGRKDHAGRLLGPLAGTDAEIGDTFTPNLALGERGTAGRGAFFSSAPLGTGSVFSHLELHGELPDGYQVELYVNEVLRASQTTANQGRYDFQNVPLGYGANTLRLVFYGPHGEQREEVRHYNFGAGQLDRGKAVVNLGAVQEGVDLIPIPRAAGPGGGAPPPAVGQGSLRLAGEIEYGLTNALTVVGGFSQYTPVTAQTRRIVEAGLRASVAGMALQVDAAKDLDGGEAAAFDLAGKVSGVSFIAQDSEYQGVFYDENQRSGLAAGDPLTRSDELRLDWIARLLKTGAAIPMSLDVQRDQKQDGSTYTTASGRFSATLASVFLSSGLQYSGTAGPHTAPVDTLSGEMEASRLFGAAWQVRAGLQYQIVPTPRAQSVFVNLDHALSRSNSLRLAVSQSLSSGAATDIQLADTWRLSRATVAVTTSFDSQTHDARIGLQLSFGLLYDPGRGGYRLVRPGATSGGDVAFNAFVDSNGDGRREAGEIGVPNLPLESPGPPVKTDDSGQALLTGLGDGATARIRVKTDSLDNPYSIPPAQVVEVNPRPGRVTQVYYGLKPVGEVQLRLKLRKPDGVAKGVSGLDVQLLTTKKDVVAEGRTEYDGAIYVEKLPPGVYAVRIEPGQARRLGLALAGPVTVTIPPSGGYVGEVPGEVVARP